jgi:phospholipid/cholesterol/gamma-HCH transport system permease protein
MSRYSPVRLVSDLGFAVRRQLAEMGYAAG